MVPIDRMRKGRERRNRGNMACSQVCALVTIAPMDKQAFPNPDSQRLPVLLAFGRVVRHLRRERGFF